MYCVYVDGEGYICDYVDENFGYSNYNPDIFMDKDLAYEIAEGINKRSGQAVIVKELIGNDDYIFPATKLTLKDLKKGDIFQYINNPNSIFAVISEEEVISVLTIYNRNPVGTIYKSYPSMNSGVKKVKL